MKHFGNEPRFAVKDFDSRGLEVAQQELTSVRSVMDALLPYRNEIPAVGVDCLPGPVPALADAAETDTLLLAYARDHITPASTRAAIVGLVVLVVPIILAAIFFQVSHPPSSQPTDGGHPLQPLAERDAITLCLVDARKGDVLWFSMQFVNKTKDLLDASDIDQLIRAAYANFKDRPE